MTSKQIRKTFLDFFHTRGHHIETSAPIVLKNDPTLMFTNAGMNQFKDLFLGNKPTSYPRICDTQKCLRVSGKHNDLDEVGVDTYHHTMFEMLGNWSFGDYFKEDAVMWAWELLTEVYKLDKNRLYVTVFEGYEKDGLSYDKETHNIWKNLIDESRIIPGSKKDNFWEMGEQGPCGPCTEIHIDLRSEQEMSKTDGKALVNADNPQVVEIWNIVFMQFNRLKNGSLSPLPAKHVDTGMGFERLCMALQGKRSNYDTDIFQPYIRKIEQISGKVYGKDEKNDIAIRVIADHIRAVSFAIADGQLPSAQGAGYVIRRILRRAVRYGYSFLNQKEPFFYKLVEVLSDEMGEQFPEITAQQKLIENVIREEETSFLRTLEQGLERLKQIENESKSDIIDGEKVFELYDTYGFPLDLTALILREKGKTIDEKAFNQQMEAQKERARKASATETDDWVIVNSEIDSHSTFIGYDALEAKTRISKYRKVKNQKGEFYQIVLEVTPFYAESGGQKGDVGYLEDEFGNKTHILDTIKENELTIHITEKLPTAVKITEDFKAVVDYQKRFDSQANHSATHLLHRALRKVLGETVEQKGSSVSSEGLRFDFSYYGKLSSEELEQVEELVNNDIKQAYQTQENRNSSLEEAKENGAMALFGEKYGNKVRTIRLGESFELCGGCHVKNTSQIRLFKILSEGAIASGVRRIEAISGDKVIEYYRNQEKDLIFIKQNLLGTAAAIKAIENLISENDELKKKVEEFMNLKANSIKQELQKTAKQTSKGIYFISGAAQISPNLAKNIAFELGANKDNAFIVLATKDDADKPNISLYISKELCEKQGYDAGKIVRELALLIGGSGGGQKHFASAGGKNSDNLNKVLSEAEKIVSQ